MAIASLFTRALVRPLVVLAACAMTFAGTAGGDEAKIDPEAKKVVEAFGKYYAGLKGFRVSVSVALQVEQQGKKQSQTFDQKFMAERPNKFFYTLASAAGGATVASDGQQMSLFIKGFNKYAVEKTPPTFAEMFANQVVLGTIGLGNASNVLIAMLSDDPAKKLLEKVESLDYGGVVELEGAKCHLLKAAGGDMDWQIWIDSGKQPLVRQFVPNLEQALARLAKGKGQESPFANMKITNIVSYKDWEVDPKFAADDFAFNVPDDAEKMGSFMEIFTSGIKQPEPEPHALLGKPAPPVELELLDGGKLDLAGLKGKNVVILDFWATWCGPCVQAMPIIDKVAEKFKDKGVLLYAVNLEEGPDEIKAFLKENMLEVPIALDSDGAVAKAYEAVAIPQTVLVGKDGSVQVVKVGLLPDLEASLTKDLEDLVAGKNLAADTLAAAKKRADETPPAEDAEKDAGAEGDKKASKKK
jgi:thiol-disulfide isomerase/thioredoxin